MALISASVAASKERDQREANKKGDAVIAGLTLAQRELVDRIIDFMNPVSLRSAGAAFDSKAATPAATC